MSYHILKHSDNIDNIIIGNRLKSDDVYSKYYMYYLKGEELCEMYIKTPKLRLIYPLNHLKFSQISVPLYPDYDINTEFIEFIKKIELYVKESFSKKKEFISLIQYKNKMPFIKANLNDNVKITSNTNSNIKLDDFKINSQIELIIKISYIWMNNEKFGISSLIYQIGYYGTLEQLNYDLLNISGTKTINKIERLEPVEQIQKIDKQNKPTIMIPSVGDLQNMIKNLKKTEKTKSD